MMIFNVGDFAPVSLHPLLRQGDTAKREDLPPPFVFVYWQQNRISFEETEAMEGIEEGAKVLGEAADNVSISSSN